tara:strand:+ start:81 stop:299 length:219 start_codon:yes stop_codon:yes gene_type:complete
MELQDHQTHLKNLVNQANTLSNEIETKRNILLKVQGAIEYLSELGVKLPEATEATEAPAETPETPPEPEVSE